MNYFRVFGAGLVLVCGALSGFYLSYNLKLRLSLYNSLLDFLSRLQTNIRYFNDDIFKLIKISCPTSLSAYYKSDIRPFQAFWQSFINSISKTYFLSKEDKNTLSEFGRILGATDVEGQLSHIEIYKGIFSEKQKSLQSEYKTKSRLYKTLGFVAGAVLALLIV